jgi:cell division protein FtsB
MNPFEFVFIILGGVVVLAVVKMRFDSQARIIAQREARIEQLDRGREAELEQEVEELRERLHVLERITVDGRETHLLSDEIEKLRDK